MQIYRQALLLFTLNFLDAVLTLFWVHNGFATEGNRLMAILLDVGDLPFLVVKIGIGALAAIVVWRWRNLRVAKYGLTLALTIYVSVMGVHFFTGLSAFGLLPETVVGDAARLSDSILAFFI
ncbi:MAG TPA: DUF5658 family protein [Pyrinomonadaceae bacterium]|nr:DUF5658 family protein [Pyrinomonadaceae bacterium]